jgi:hypothetical protein
VKLIQGFYMTSQGVDSIDLQVYDFTNWLWQDPSNSALVEMLIVGNEAIMNVLSYLSKAGGSDRRIGFLPVHC